MDKTVYIYGLREIGTDDIRYVGQTIYPKERLSQHKGEADTSSTHPKKVWIGEVIASGGDIEICILEECAWDDTGDRERHWINYCRLQGSPLTNRGPAQNKPKHRTPSILPAQSPKNATHSTYYNDDDWTDEELDAFSSIEEDLREMCDSADRIIAMLKDLTARVNALADKWEAKDAAVARLEARQA